MGRQKLSNLDTSVQLESAQQPLVHNFVVRRPRKDVVPVDSQFNVSLMEAYLQGLERLPFGLDFDVWSYSRGDLYAMILASLSSNNLLQLLGVSVRELFAFVQDIDRGYLDNPYHSFLHAVDVYQILYFFLFDLQAGAYLQPMDILGILIGALCHDLAHPGVNNLYLVNTHAKLAIMYNDISVLENYSCAQAFNLGKKHGLFVNLQHAEYRALREVMIKGILATDMSCHFELQGVFQAFASNRPETLSKDNKILIMKVLLHAADISNPCRPWALCKKWSDRVVEEFFLQGDLEKFNKLPLSPNMDRDVNSQPQISVDFIDFLVRPFYSAIALFLPKASVFMGALEDNYVRWKELRDNLAQVENADIGSLSSSLSSSRDFHLQRRLSVAAGTVTIPESVISKLTLEMGFDAPSDEAVDTPTTDEVQKSPTKKRKKGINKTFLQNIIKQRLQEPEQAAVFFDKKLSKQQNHIVAKSLVMIDCSSFVLDLVSKYRVGSDVDPMLMSISRYVGKLFSASCAVFLVDSAKTIVKGWSSDSQSSEEKWDTLQDQTLKNVLSMGTNPTSEPPSKQGNVLHYFVVRVGNDQPPDNCCGALLVSRPLPLDEQELSVASGIAGLLTAPLNIAIPSVALLSS